jgi:hypothetical protein
MRVPARLRFGLIVGSIVALTTAGIGLASVGSDPLPDEITSCQPPGDGTDGVISDDQTGQDEADEAEEAQGSEEADQNDQGDEVGHPDENDDAEEADDPSACGDADQDESDRAKDGGTTVTPETGPADEPSPERIAACTEAAGLTSADAPTEEPKAGELHGLENAIAHVLWNCMRNDNDGLPNALEHLKANLDRKLLHDELKAQRAAEREAAKAARKAAHAAAKAARAATHSS